MLRYLSSADRRSVIARLPAMAGSMSAAPRCRPSRIFEWCPGSRAAAAGRSPSRLRRNGEARWRGCAGRYGRRGAQPLMPTRSRAVLAIIVIAHPEAKPTCGASARINNRRHDDFGRPLRRYPTMAAPTSGGIGIRARCRPLARTSISLARQSISSRVSVATSPARRPSLASIIRMA